MEFLEELSMFGAIHQRLRCADYDLDISVTALQTPRCKSHGDVLISARITSGVRDVYRV